MENKNCEGRRSERVLTHSRLSARFYSLYQRCFNKKEMSRKKINRNPKTASETDVSHNHLQMTDVGFRIMQDCGLTQGRTKTITQLLAERESGLTTFTNSHKRQIASRFVPNYLALRLALPRKTFCGIFSKNGDYFFSGCQDAKIRVFEPKLKKLIKTDEFQVMHMGWSVLDLALNSDTSKLIYSSWSDKLYLCDLLQPNKPQVSLDMNLDANLKDNFCLFSVVFLQDDKEILGGSHQGQIVVYNLEAMRRTIMADGHSGDINTVSFADDSSFIFISGGDDGLCKVWDRRMLMGRRPKPVGVFAGHHDGVTFVDSKKDGMCFLSNSKDQTIKLWDIRKFSSRSAAMATRREVKRRNWDYRWQGILREDLPRISGDTSLMTYKGHQVRSTLIRARFSPIATTGQRFIYCGSASGQVHIYDILTGKTVSILRGHTDTTRDVHWHPYIPILASSSWDSTVGYWTYCEEDLFQVSELFTKSDLVSSSKPYKDLILTSGFR